MWRRCQSTRHRASLRSAKPCKRCARQLPQGAAHKAARHACRPQAGERQDGCASPDTSPSCSDAARAAGARPVPSSCAAAASPPSTCRASRRSPASPGNNRQSTKQRNQKLYPVQLQQLRRRRKAAFHHPRQHSEAQCRRGKAAVRRCDNRHKPDWAEPVCWAASGDRDPGPLLLVHESGHMALCIR